LFAALVKIGEPADAPSVVIGDSVYDVMAAEEAWMPAIVLRCGGFGDDELRKVGAIAIYDTPADLVEALDETVLA
jgi:phosphoglycolate phosphatase-like HAD superfamily hydrolase